jgi:hypothetical protein
MFSEIFARVHKVFNVSIPIQRRVPAHFLAWGYTILQSQLDIDSKFVTTNPDRLVDEQLIIDNKGIIPKMNFIFTDSIRNDSFAAEIVIVDSRYELLFIIPNIWKDDGLYTHRTRIKIIYNIFEYICKYMNSLITIPNSILEDIYRYAPSVLTIKFIEYNYSPFLSNEITTSIDTLMDEKTISTIIEYSVDDLLDKACILDIVNRKTIYTKIIK